jgi:DNA-binding winged helix-turn-helix (wHTH) protein
MYQINGFRLAADFSSATKNGTRIVFSHQEQTALALFIESEDGFVDVQSLEAAIWEGKIVTDNSLRKLISGLRSKLESKSAFTNFRGKGYRLIYDSIKPNNIAGQKPSSKISILAISVFIPLICVWLLIDLFSNKGESLPKVSQKTVFESNDYILDYAIYNDELFVTTRSTKKSTLYKTVNRKNSVLMSADFSGAFRGIEIHSSGRTVLHVIEDAKCIIKIFERPIDNLIDEIPCNRQNAFPSFDWIDKDRLYLTYNINSAGPIRPYIYDLRTKNLERVTSIDFNSLNGKKFIDSFIKARDNGIFSLRMDNLDQMSLMYFDESESTVLYEYRAKPYSIGVSDTDLFFVGNNNELFRLNLTDDIHAQDAVPTLFLAPQSIKIDDPLVLEDNLYISLGNTSQEGIFSMSGNFTHRLGNGIFDFSYNDQILTILGSTNSGYAIEQMKDGIVVKSVYIDTTLTFRHIEYHDEVIYLAGSSGIYRLLDNGLHIVSDLRTVNMVSNGQCMIAEGEDSIAKFSEGTGTFTNFATQGERIFASKQGCLFVDNISQSILDENRQFVAKPKMKKQLFEHKGKIAHWQSIGDRTQISDIETGEVIAAIKNRALYQRLISYEDDILYLGQVEANTSIIKLNTFD